MPSFDAVLEPNLVEVKNAVDQTAKEIGTRFDFKGTSARVELKEKEITLYGDSDFQINQVTDVLLAKLSKRSVDARFLDRDAKIEKIGGDKVKQLVVVKSGIDGETAKKLQTARQAEQAQGPGLDPGRHGARLGRQARRAAGGDRADQEGDRRPAASFTNFRD
jgi:uncharacterized protein YajQ (UPF0234 family)